MKNAPIIIESHLITKSTAALREEIISELTMPDKSLSLLLEDTESKDNNETKNSPEFCD
jgi:hypothetical protein